MKNYEDLLPHQQRVVIERNELADKYAKLCLFLMSHIFMTLENGEQSRLENQSLIMKLYLNVLDERIKFFQ